MTAASSACCCEQDGFNRYPANVESHGKRNVNHDPDCPLCKPPGGAQHELLWRCDDMYLVRVLDEQLPCFFRLVLNEHIAEMSDLDELRRVRLWSALHLIEHAIRRHVSPDKMNLASLGNQVPHLHWHLIGRWRDDPFFPDPVWAPARRDAAGREWQLRRCAVEAEMPTLRDDVVQALSNLRAHV